MENFKKINIGNIDNNIPHDLYFIDKSYDDQEQACIHLPVKMVKANGVIDVDIDIDKIETLVLKKYPDLIFSGKWSTLNENRETKEYLFFYNKP
ncbi:MAG: hypothetical protein WCT42_01680 [Candidatus Paceibacterota bacterium]